MWCVLAKFDDLYAVTSSQSFLHFFTLELQEYNDFLKPCLILPINQYIVEKTLVGWKV